AGKSTLGNLLLGQPHDEGPFHVSGGMESCTQECFTSMVNIDGVNYNLVDTPGILDTQKPTSEIFEKIAKTVQQCAYGIKAILFVFEARRFTDEQKKVLQGITMFLGEEAMNYIIAIFSRTTKKQNSSRDEMRKAWNPVVSSFIDQIDNRWGISPDSDHFLPDDPIHKARLGEIRAFIAGTRGIYTTKAFELAQGKNEAEKIYQERYDEMQKDYDKRYEESLKSTIEGMRQKYESQIAEIEARRVEAERISRERLAEAEARRAEAERVQHENISEMKRGLAEAEARRAESERIHLEKLYQVKEEFNQREHEIIRSRDSEIAGLRSQIDNLRRDEGCFALDTKVQLASGKMIEMKELQVGDYVLSDVRNNKPEFSEVYLISHMGHHDGFLEMVRVEFTNPDGSKGHIRTTPKHYIFRSDLSILYARDVVPKETRILVLNKSNELISVTVDSLFIEQDTGYIGFYTRAGTVIANNILCSCYDDCPPSQALMDLVFAPIRLWTKVFPSNHRQKELHPYVQILETVYSK
ncbi:14195_t:CDS:2, partial [Acaulospora morrowiae]